MNNQISKLWLFGPPFALLLTALFYYSRVDTFRQWADSNFPWVKRNIGVHIRSNSHPAPASASPSASRMPDDAAPPTTIQPEPTPSPALAPAPEPPAPPAKPIYVQKDGTVDLETLAANQGDWPKKLRLRKPVPFPAVIDGKVVGELTAPAGTEVTLRRVNREKIGVEYKGGGGWIAPEDTDIRQRLQ